MFFLETSISGKNLKWFDFIVITQCGSFFDLSLALLFGHKIFKATVHVFLSLISLKKKKGNEFYTVTFIVKKKTEELHKPSKKIDKFVFVENHSLDISSWNKTSYRIGIVSYRIVRRIAWRFWFQNHTRNILS